MQVLVFNAGSSSLKFGVFNLDLEDSRIFKGEFEAFVDGKCTLHFRIGGEQGVEKQRVELCGDIEAAIVRLPEILMEFGYHQFDAIGHRVVHGGDCFRNAAWIDDNVLKSIEGCVPMAPQHNRANLQAIAVSRRVWPDSPQIAVFDTAYHQTIPDYAYTYAVPLEWRQHGLRRYGFHGTSHKYVGLRVAAELKCAVADLRIISCHLGNGASICAIDRGSSIDTSMGMTPLEGLVMGNRSGDVDPGMFSFLRREFGLNCEEVERRLYAESGLKALTGSHDLRVVEQAAADGDYDAQLAVRLYAYRVRKYIGAYAAALGGFDVLAFTGGIGENSAAMRQRICEQFEFLGLSLDQEKNRMVDLQGYAAPQIQLQESRVKVIVTQTCEQLMIAQEVKNVLDQTSDWNRTDREVVVENPIA